MSAFPSFIGPSYTARSQQADCERTINLFLERSDVPGSRFPWSLYSAPGLPAFGSVGLAPGRAAFAQDGRCFAVIGYGFYEIDSAGVATLRDTVENDGLPATISSSGDAGGELFITAGGKGYCYNLGSNALTTELTSGANVGAYVGGYFLSLDTSISTLRISDFLDGTTWDPSQVALRSSAPDKWVGMLVVHDEIWLFGTETSEIWRDYGTASPAYPFVFAPVPGAVIEQGIGAAFSVARAQSTPIWLGANEQGQGVVYRGNGYGVPRRISNHAVETAIQGYETISDALAFAMQYRGHTFYVLTFPTADHTWVYDDTSEQWVEWLFWDVDTATWRAYRPMFHAMAFGDHFALDRQTGAYYRMAADTYTDAGGAPLRRLRRAPLPATDDTRVILDEFSLTADVGVGLSTGQGSDPQAMLRLSRDTGHAWGNEHWTSLGAMGEYRTRVIWNRLGQVRGDRGVLEVVVADPVPFSVSGAALEARRGLS